MTIALDTPLGRIAAEHPLATRVFARHRLDFCCGGGRTLREAAGAKGLDAATVLRDVQAEIARAQTSGDPAAANWDTASARDIIDHIVATYHVPLREELPRLTAMARKVAAVHGEIRPDTLPALADVVAGLREELEAHMAEEERVVFPQILGADTAGGTAATDRLAALEHEHAEAGAALGRIRELTGDFEVPGEACATWRALWAGLEELERTMHEHVHLENHVLFPRARA